MGIVKDAWMEAEDYVWEETSVEFICPECGELSDGSAEIPKVDEEFLSEIDTDIEVECFCCHQQFGANLILTESDCSIKLHGSPETKVTFEPIFFAPDTDYDDWLEEEYYYERSKEPFPVFQRSHDDVVAFLDDHGDENGHNAMNRMIFAQSFSVFEAYLCDTFLNFVFYDESNQNLFMQQHSEMKKLTISVSELLVYKKLTADEIIKKKITHIIKETLFHNFQKRLVLFRMYGIDMFPDEKEKVALFKAVEYRHHCVHRNGCDKEGNKLDVYTQSYVLEIITAMMSSVTFIEKNISKKIIEKPIPF